MAFIIAVTLISLALCGAAEFYDAAPADQLLYDADLLMLVPTPPAGTGYMNLARGQPTWQSSTLNQFVSSRAVDGNRDQNMFHGSCAHTGLADANPWWAVDLGKPYDIFGVDLFNRADCCGGRMDNFIVGLTNNPPNTMPPTNGELAVCGQWKGAARNGAVMFVQCADNLPASRYVVILIHRAIMNFCEVQVYGKGMRLTNVAQGRPTWQSSTLGQYDSSRSVDGNKDTNMFHGHCSHTGPRDYKPWWAVDLGKLYDIYSVDLTNRGDCCPARLNNFIIAVTNVAPLTRSPTSGGYQVCGQWPGPTPLGRTLSVRCAAGLMSARYVVVMTNQEYMNFCELEVYASEASPCQGSPCQHDGLCTANGDSYTCSCAKGWTGVNCATEVNVCLQSNPCKNGGTCLKFGDGYECRCTAGWAGHDCTMGSSSCHAMKPDQRMNCGWGGVTLADCNARSCCFDTTVPNRPTCFYSSWPCDSIAAEERVECGWKDITYNQCINRGCCFDDSDTNEGHVCFMRVNPACIGVPSAKRIQRGDSNIQPNECLAKGWCWDGGISQDEGPWCFSGHV